MFVTVLSCCELYEQVNNTSDLLTLNVNSEKYYVNWIEEKSFLLQYCIYLSSEEAERCQLACRGVVSQGRGGCLVHAGTGSHSRVWASLYVCVCVSCLTMCPTVCVCVCVVHSHYEQKAQVRNTERKDMLDLPTALRCMLPKKRSYVTETSTELM